MNPYSQFLLPRLLDWAMSDQTFSQYRKELLSQVTGDTLEIGFGTGLNLPYYPSDLQKLTAIDANPGMSAIAQKRIRESRIVVDHRVLNGESLPIADCQFDSVVSTWTLCSIAKVEQALQEIHRVLKPGGRFFFIEHGLSRDAKTQVWQHRLTPIQKVIADGCHLDRDIRQLVERQFGQVAIDEFQPENLSAVISYFYKGVAIK
ncbi:MAG: class I SAM-dependent methyltransferase [Phormidesmis sp. CAN_BIN44]|nr:class I SAM-dependent methyltransferase [Phormidesmis sp. CAN_BIN44]